MPHLKRGSTISLIAMILGIAVLVAVWIVMMTPGARGATVVPHQSIYTCEDVRRLVAEKGKVAAIAFAVEQGLSIRQIWQIRRTCKV